MNDKEDFRRNEKKSIEREFFPLQDVLNGGASFVKYLPFDDEISPQSLNDTDEEDRNA